MGVVDVVLRAIDILELDDEGKIASIWMVADELGGLSAIGAAGLIIPTGDAAGST